MTAQTEPQKVSSVAGEVDEDARDSKADERAFAAHLAQYEAMRAESLSATSLQNQLVNYGLAIIVGAVTLLALGQTAVLTQQAFVSLVASILLSAVSWALLELEVRIHDIGRYLEQVLRPKVQKLVGREDPSQYVVLKWEFSNRLGIRWIFRGMLVVGKFAIAYVPSILFIVVFYSLAASRPWALYEIVLFWVAAAMDFVIPVGLVFNMLFVIDYYRRS